MGRSCQQDRAGRQTQNLVEMQFPRGMLSEGWAWGFLLPPSPIFYHPPTLLLVKQPCLGTQKAFYNLRLRRGWEVEGRGSCNQTDSAWFGL